VYDEHIQGHRQGSATTQTRVLRENASHNNDQPLEK
jgi:hypothetical protein